MSVCLYVGLYISIYIYIYIYLFMCNDGSCTTDRRLITFNGPRNGHHSKRYPYLHEQANHGYFRSPRLASLRFGTFRLHYTLDCWRVYYEKIYTVHAHKAPRATTSPIERCEHLAIVFSRYSPDMTILQYTSKSFFATCLAPTTLHQAPNTHY